MEKAISFHSKVSLAAYLGTLQPLLKIQPRLQVILTPVTAVIIQRTQGPVSVDS